MTNDAPTGEGNGEISHRWAVGQGTLLRTADGGATVNRAGDVAAVNEPLAAAFLTTAKGWVVGENLKARTFAIEATADAGRTWTTQYATG